MKEDCVTYYGSKNLADSFRTVRNNTVTIAEEIPADKYGFKAAPETMSVAEMLAHLAVAYLWQIDFHSRHGSRLEFGDFMVVRQQVAEAERALVTGGREDILKALKDNGRNMAMFLESLDEKFLAETVSFPEPVKPPTKSRFEMLLGVKEHEMHHRGQLMLIQRLLGQVPHLTRMRQQMQAHR